MAQYSNNDETTLLVNEPEATFRTAKAGRIPDNARRKTPLVLPVILGYKEFVDDPFGLED